MSVSLCFKENLRADTMYPILFRGLKQGYLFKTILHGYRTNINENRQERGDKYCDRQINHRAHRYKKKSQLNT